MWALLLTVVVALDVSPHQVVAPPASHATVPTEKKTAFIKTSEDPPFVTLPADYLMPERDPIREMFTEIVVLALLGLIWSVACMGKPRMENWEGSKDDMKGDFAPIGLFGCFNLGFKGICETFCCMNFMWAETISKTQIASLTTALIVMVVLSVLHPVTMGFSMLLFIIVRAYARTTMRTKYGQGEASIGNTCYDVLVHMCCCFCAVGQEAMFVEMHKTHNPAFLEDIEP